ncbi:MAG TPA: hypothetical protein PLG48_00815 [Candidatus Avimonas sp.]|nr:DUF3298 and DUF4163 domain-containing protein [Clostridiales bacterium]HPU58035.1 hypothetical protein [Candidatus Avimonas sp.]
MRRLFEIFAAVILSTATLTNIGDIAISSVSEGTAGENFVFNASYPRFFGIGDSNAQKSLNAQIYEIAQQSLYRTKALSIRLPSGDRPGQSKAEGTFDYEVKRNSGGIASLLLLETLSCGDSYKSQAKKGFTFYTSSGKILKISDLFKNSEEGLGCVNSEIAAQINERGLSKSIQKLKPEVCEDCDFYITDTDLVVIIPELTWFSREAGIVEFAIPLKNLNRYLIDILTV